MPDERQERQERPEYPPEFAAALRYDLALNWPRIEAELAKFNALCGGDDAAA